MRRKEDRSKQGQTNNKAKQHNTPKAVTFLQKNELPRVGLKPTTLYTLDRALYHNIMCMQVQYTFFSKSLHFFLALLELKMDDFRRLFLSNLLASVLTEGRSRSTTASASPAVALAEELMEGE